MGTPSEGVYYPLQKYPEIYLSLPLITNVFTSIYKCVIATFGA